MRKGHHLGMHSKTVQAQENGEKWKNKIFHFDLDMNQGFSLTVYWFCIYLYFCYGQAKIIKSRGHMNLK